MSRKPSPEAIAQAVACAARYCPEEKAISIVAMRRRDLTIAEVRDAYKHQNPTIVKAR